MIVIAPKTEASAAGKTARTAPLGTGQAREPASDVQVERESIQGQKEPETATVSRKTEPRKAQARRKPR